MADQEIINYGSAPNDGTGDPLRDAFIKVDNNFGAIWNAGPVGSNIRVINNIIESTNVNGNIVLKPNGIGVVQARNNILPSANNTYSLGSPSAVFYSAHIGSGGISVSGNFNIGNLVTSNVVANGLVVTSGSNTWTLQGDTFTAPTGASWRSDIATNDEYIRSAVDGYINISTYDAADDEASEIQVEHGLIEFNFYNGSNASWVFDGIQASTQLPGNLTTAGNISAGYFLGDGSLLTNLASGSELVNGNSNVRVLANGNITISASGSANVAVFSATGLTLVGNMAAGNLSGNGAGISSVVAERGTDTNNWNTLVQMGVYKVNRTSWSGTIGTPVDSSVFVGLLQVLTVGDSTSQIFMPGTVDVNNQNIQWNRSYWNGIWTNWIKIVNDGQIIDAGSY